MYNVAERFEGYQSDYIQKEYVQKMISAVLEDYSVMVTGTSAPLFLLDFHDNLETSYIMYYMMIKELLAEKKDFEITEDESNEIDDYIACNYFVYDYRLRMATEELLIYMGCFYVESDSLITHNEPIQNVW